MSKGEIYEGKRSTAFEHGHLLSKFIIKWFILCWKCLEIIHIYNIQIKSLRCEYNKWIQIFPSHASHLCAGTSHHSNHNWAVSWANVRDPSYFPMQWIFIHADEFHTNDQYKIIMCIYQCVKSRDQYKSSWLKHLAQLRKKKQTWSAIISNTHRF